MPSFAFVQQLLHGGHPVSQIPCIEGLGSVVDGTSWGFSARFLQLGDSGWTYVALVGPCVVAVWSVWRWLFGAFVIVSPSFAPPRTMRTHFDRAGLGPGEFQTAHVISKDTHGALRW